VGLQGLREYTSLGGRPGWPWPCRTWQCSLDSLPSFGSTVTRSATTEQYAEQYSPTPGDSRLKNSAVSSLQAERQRREAAKKRKEEAQKRAEVTQKISNPATLKKMLKSKKLRKTLRTKDD
jgi:hypothetical protein